MLNGSSIHKSKGQEPIVVWDSWGIGGLFYNIYICEWWKDQINTISNSNSKINWKHILFIGPGQSISLICIVVK